MNQQPRQVRIGVELTPTATMDDLRTTLHTDTGIDRDHIILAEINETGKILHQLDTYLLIPVAVLRTKVETS